MHNAISLNFIEPGKQPTSQATKTMHYHRPDPAPYSTRFNNSLMLEDKEAEHAPNKFETLEFWQDDTKTKTSPQIKEQLQAYAKKHKCMPNFKLKNTYLNHIDLVNRGQKEGYTLQHADLYRANLKNAHLFGIDLSHSSLMKADLRGANLHNANLYNTNLLGVRLEGAKLDGINWGKMIRQERLARESKDPAKRTQLFTEAEEIYRNIGRELKHQGMNHTYGWFLYREMVTRRMRQPLWSFKRLASKFVDIICGYGEKPLRLVITATLIILSFAFLYSLVGLQHDGTISKLSNASTTQEYLSIFFDSLYFSIVTFTTLGYGDFSPVGISRVIASIQAFTGSFTIALFVVVFVRRMTR